MAVMADADLSIFWIISFCCSGVSFVWALTGSREEQEKSSKNNSICFILFRDEYAAGEDEEDTYPAYHRNLFVKMLSTRKRIHHINTEMNADAILMR